MSSPSTGTTSHGGGWFWPVIMTYAAIVAAVWAIWDFSPWVFIIGTLGAIGAGWLGYHVGHVVGHFFHSPFVEWVCRAFGAMAVLYMLVPLFEWRDVLTTTELRLYMWGGFTSILFLSIELGHLVHDHGRQTILGIGTSALLVGLYLGRPDGAEFDTNFVVARPRPVTGSWITPGPTITQTFPPAPSSTATTVTPATPPASAAKALPAGTRVGPAGFAPVKCSDLSYHERKRRGC